MSIGHKEEYHYLDLRWLFYDKGKRYQESVKEFCEDVSKETNPNNIHLRILI